MNRVLIAGLALAISLAVACGGGSDGGGDGGVLTPTPVNPSGQWSVTWSETSNNCSASAPNETHGVLLSLAGSQLAWQDEGDTCDASPDFTYANDQVSDASQDQFLGSDGCTYTEAITGTVQFTQNNFSGSYVTTYTRTGSNCSDYPNGCQIRTAVSATRCQGCYDGCQ